jgi:amidase
MARTVRDAAILLGALAASDRNDPVTNSSPGNHSMDYTLFLQKDGLKGKRIGIESSHLQGPVEVVAVYERAMELMKNLGATMVEVDLLDKVRSIPAISRSEFLVLAYEFKDGVNRYLSASASTMKKLEDVIAFNNANSSTAMPYFKQETLIECAAKVDLNSEEYKFALSKTLSSRAIINNMLSEKNLDALCGVTNGLACCIDLANGDYDTGFSFSTPAAIAGFPHITVPMGFVFGLPVGISFFGKAYSEPGLLSIAYAYEQASKERRAPQFHQNLLS